MARSDTRQREEMRAWQAHAAFHYAAGLQGIHLNERNCPFPRFPDGTVLKGQEFRDALDEYRARLAELLSKVEMTCPMRGVVAKADSPLWEWEHAPQHSGRSILGPWAMACWTCGPCNHKCGDSFESDVARPSRLSTMARLGLLDPQHLRYMGRMVVPRTPAQMLTDVKAAFTVAFTPSSGTPGRSRRQSRPSAWHCSTRTPPSWSGTPTSPPAALSAAVASPRCSAGKGSSPSTTGRGPW